MRRVSICCALVSGLLLAACPGFGDRGPPVLGEVPTWNGEIGPLIVTECANCHGVPATNGAPASFRLDVFETQDGIPGARSQSARILARTRTGQGMPPAGNLPFEDQALIEAWVDGGAPEGDR
ncbi:MAG: hypothetical protein AAFZ18_15935 [Myxococcota bacterium]